MKEEHQTAPLHVANNGVAFELEGNEEWHGLEEAKDAFTVLQLVLRQVQVGQCRVLSGSNDNKGD